MASKRRLYRSAFALDRGPIERDGHIVKDPIVGDVPLGRASVESHNRALSCEEDDEDDEDYDEIEDVDRIVHRLERLESKLDLLGSFVVIHATIFLVFACLILISLAPRLLLIGFGLLLCLVFVRRVVRILYRFVGPRSSTPRHAA
jgi:hypothetical protein